MTIKADNLVMNCSGGHNLEAFELFIRKIDQRLSVSPYLLCHQLLQDYFVMTEIYLPFVPVNNVIMMKNAHDGC